MTKDEIRLPGGERKYAKTGHKKHDAYQSEMSTTTSLSRDRDQDVKSGLNESKKSDFNKSIDLNKSIGNQTV